MIRINLLPSAAPRSRFAPRRGGAKPRAARSAPAFAGDPWMAGLVVLGMAVLLWVAYGFWRTGERQAELTERIEAEVADSTRFASTIGLLDAVRARQDTIQQKIQVIRSVDTRRYEWPHVLDEVSRAMPSFTWLSKLAASDPAPVAPVAPADSAAAAAPVVPEGPAFTIEGNTGSTQALTAFMKRLEESPFIRHVGLVTSEQITEEGRTFQKFTLEARYEEPDPAFVQTIPVVLDR